MANRRNAIYNDPKLRRNYENQKKKEEEKEKKKQQAKQRQKTAVSNDVKLQKNYNNSNKTTTPNKSGSSAYTSRSKEMLAQREQKKLQQARIAQKNNPSQVTKEQKKVLESSEIGNTGKVVRASMKQVAGGDLKALGYDSNRYNEQKKIIEHNYQMGKITDSERKKQISNLDKSGIGKAYKNWESDRSHKFFESVYKKGQKLNEQGDKEYEKATKGSKGLEKAYYGAVNAGVGMLADMAAGPAWWASMATRTLGNNLGSTREKGTTQLQDERYAALQALKEVGTEMMFAGAGLAKKMVSGKALVSGADKLADLLTRNIQGQFAKNVVGTLTKAFGGAVEENLEEVAGWGLDPQIANISYGNELQKKNEDDIRTSIQSQLAGLDRNEMNAIISSINSDAYIDNLTKAYIENGAPKDVAQNLALQMREYMAASLSGDTESAKNYENALVETFSGLNPVKETYSLSDLKDTLASTTLLTLATGLPMASVETSQGQQMKDALGKEGVKALTETAINFEDDAISVRAQAMRDSVNNGGDLSGIQVGELSNALNQQYEKDAQRQNASNQAAQKLIKEDGSISPVSYNENGDIAYIGKKTAEILHENNENVSKIIEDSKVLESLPEEKSNAIGQAVSNYMTGVLTVGDANELTATNVEARQVFELATGEKLPTILDKAGNIDIVKTNTATKEYLFQNSAKNLANTAKAETANFYNEQKPVLDKDVMSRLGANGQTAYVDITSKLDIRNTPNYMINADAIATYYSAGRNSSFENFAELQRTVGDNPVFAGVSLDARKQAFNAGLEDKYLAQTKAGAVVKQGETKADTSYKGKGEIYIETESIKNDDVELFNSLAKGLNVNIHIVDNLPTSNGGQANGIYKDGEIWLNVNETTDRNIGYVFMHEVTHYIKDNAPEQFNELEQMVRNAWFEFDNNGMQQAIKQKIDLYKANGQTLTEAEAMEEIIADATYEMLQDEEFANQVSDENPSLARAILDGIRSALRKLREMFAMKGGFTPRYNAGLLSTLDILKEAEQLWLNALHTAAKNSADGFIAENNANISLKNENISKDYQVPFTYENNYIDIKNGDSELLEDLRKEVKEIKRDNYKNIATGFEAKINKKTISKIIYPTKGFNPYAYNYIDNLYAAKHLPELFENAVYIDSFEQQKSGNAENKYHHFVAPMLLGNEPKRVLITAVESSKTKFLYIVNTEVLDIKKDEAPNSWQSTVSLGTTSTISVADLVNNVKLVNYSNNSVDTYNIQDLKFSISEQQDTDYLQAVESGDMEKAQQMVDEAAKRAGYEYDGYHGSTEKFTVFKKNWNYFSSDENVADTYKGAQNGNKYHVYIKMRNPYVFDANYSRWSGMPVDEELKKQLQDYGNGVFEEDGDWRTSTNDIVSLVEDLRDEGENYDGVIVKNVDDTGMGGEKSIIADDYILFNSNNAKSADPVTYDDNGNVIPLSERFNTENEDIRFSLSEPVEEKGDLVAVHNLREDNLRQALELGGFAMPSIAVVKAGSGHEKYGEYSAVFNKETIAPELNRNNKVYGGDAWTPTFPQADYKISEAVNEKIFDRIKGIVGEDIIRNWPEPTSLDYDNMSDIINRNRGDAISAYKNKALLKYAFLKDNGENVELEYTDAPLQRASSFTGNTAEDNKIILKFAKEFGEKRVSEWNENRPTGTELEKEIEEVRQFINKHFYDKYKDASNGVFVELYKPEDWGFAKTDNLMTGALHYFRDGIKKKIDTSSFDNTNNAINESEYNEWLSELFDGIVEKTGFRNNNELFTPTGNRRSWEALHDDFTLTNVVKQMKNQDNGDSWLGGVLKAVANKNYKSIKEIKEDSTRLKKISEEEYESMMSAFGEREYKILERISNASSSSEGNQFIRRDEVRSTIVDDVRDGMSKEEMLADMKKWSATNGATMEDIDDIFQLVADIANAPTEYFEAKPQRAVKFDEINTLIAPDNAPTDLIDELENRGVNINMYKAENEADRLAKLNSIENARFSIPETDELQQARDNLFKYENEVKTLKNYVKTLQERKNTEGVSDEEKQKIDEDIYRAELMIAKNETLADTQRENIEIFEDSMNNFNVTEDLEERERALNQVIAELMQPAAPIPTEDEVLESIAENQTEFDNDVPRYNRLLEESRQRRQNIEDEVKAYGEKKHKDTVLTHDLVLNEKSVNAACLEFTKTIMQNSEYVNTHGRNAQYNKDVLDFVKDAEKKMFAEYKAGKYEELWNTAFDTAAWLNENITVIDDERFSQYLEFRDYFRAQKIYVPDNIKSDFSKGYGAFLRYNMGRLVLTNDPSNPTIDMIWDDAVEKFGGLLDIDLEHPADMLEDISNAMDSLEDYTVAYESEEAYAVIKSMAEDLLDICMDQGEAWHSFADRKKAQYDMQTKRLKERHKEAMRAVREKQKEKIQEVKEYYKEREQKAKEKNERKELNRKLGNELDWLSNALLKPTDNIHIPHGYDSAVAQLLASIDRQSERSKQLEKKYGVSGATMQLLKLKREYEKLANNDDTGMIIDDDLIALMDELGDKVDNRPLYELTNSEIKDVYQIVRTITHTLRNMNTMVAESYKENLGGTVDKIIKRVDDILKVKKSKYGKKFDRANNKFILNSMAKPGWMFEWFGGGLYDAYMGIRLGMDQEVNDLKYLQESYIGIFKKYFNRKKPGSDIEKWRNGKETIDFTLENGEQISITPAQAMSLYATSLREAAWEHMYKGGVCFTNRKISKDSKDRIGERVHITANDVANITKMLTQEQNDIADALLNLLHGTPTQWANEVSLKLYGYEKYTEENYYPMTVQDDWLPTDVVHRDGVPARLKNPSFSKALTEHASNPLIIDDMFSVVTGHLASVLLYHSYAIPVNDFLRVYNYKYVDENGDDKVAVKELIRKAFGDDAITYINRFLNDVNGMNNSRKDGLTQILDFGLSGIKRASVGMNMRVVLQQPMAVARAWMYISPKYFAKIPFTQIKQNYKEMTEHCPITWWKAQNHSDINMGHSLDEMMMNRSWNKYDILTFGLAAGADNVTWAWIWSAVKKEVKANNPNVEYGSQEFWDLCNERASYIFDQTQVVDSVLHRSDVMRSKDNRIKSLTSFMAEPTTTENMLIFSYMESLEQAANGNKLKAFNTCRKAVMIYAINAAMVSLGESIWDVVRDAAGDDDDKEKFLEHWWENFKDNLNPLNLLPLIKDVVSVFKGWDPQDLSIKAFIDIAKSVRGFFDEPSFENAFDSVQSIAVMFGLPVKTVIKDFKALSTILFGSYATELDSGESEGLATKLLGGFWDKAGVKDGSGFDKFLNFFGMNLTDAEKAERDYQHRLSEIQDKIKGLSGEEKDDKIWSMASDDYTKAVANGDLDAIRNIRRMVADLGGNMEEADKRILDKMKSAYKQTIGVPGKETMQAEYREFMQGTLGVTDAELSRDIVYSSEMGKKFKAACRIQDVDMAVEALTYLYDAGIRDVDVDRLWQYRKSGDVSKYLPQGSTGTYVWPVDGEISSKYGYRDAPTAGASTYHQGIDIGARSGANVGAADGGEVIYADYDGGYGYTVGIRHEDGTYTQYSHLKQMDVMEGDTVSKSQTIGKVGSTGTSTGPHLHFAMLNKNGEYVNPMKYLK